MKRFFLRVGSDFPDRVEWAAVAGGGPVLVATGTLAEAAEAARGQRVTVLLPGSDVLLVEAQVPAAGRKRLLQAVPYALEEQLASDVEDLHFAIGSRQSDGTLPVAAVDRELFASRLEALTEAGIEAEAILAETLAVPHQAGAWTILIDVGNALVRTGPTSGFAVDSTNLGPLLAAELKDAGEEVPRLHFLVAEGEMPGLPEAVALLVDERHRSEDLLAILAQGYEERNALNLLQGEFSRHAQWDRLWQRWQLPLVLLLVVALLQGGLLTRDIVELGKRGEALDGRIEAAFRQAFPEIQKIVNPQAQMEHQLAALRDTSGGEFLDLLDACGSILLNTPGFELQSLRYHGGVLDLDFEIKDLQTLDGLKERLDATAGLAVEIRTASARGDAVQARMQIKERS